MKVIKKIFKYLGILILVLIIALASAPYLFKDQLVQLVKDIANENVNGKIEFGEFDLSVISSFPDFTFNISDVSVVGVGEFEGDTLAAIPHLNLTLDLMSVIVGDQYKLKSLLIDRADIYAKVLKDGTANWDIAAEGEETEEIEDTSSTSFNMELQSLAITDANVTYDDASLGFFMDIQDLDFSMSGDLGLDVTTLQTQTNIAALDMDYEGVRYMSKTALDIKADLEADLVNSKYTFKDNEIKVNELFLGLDGFVQLKENEDMDMDLTYLAKKTEFKNFLSLIPGAYTADFASIQTKGKLGLDGNLKGTYNEESLPGFGLNLVIQDAMFKYPDLPSSVTNIQVDLHVNNASGNPDHTVINVPKFHVELGGTAVDMTLGVKTPVSDANINSTINGTVDLAKLKDMIPLEEGEKLSGIITSDIALNGKMSTIENEQYEAFDASGSMTITDMVYASTDFPQGVNINTMTASFSPQFLSLDAFDSKIGNSDIKANGRIDNYMAYTFKDEPLHGAFNMDCGTMDLNEFMEEEEEEVVAEGEEEPLEVIEVPANINFNISSSFGKLLYDNMEMSNVKGDLVIKDQKIDMTNLYMDMLGGSMVVNGSYATVNPEKPDINFAMDIKGFDIPQTFKTFNTVQQLAPIAGYSTGAFSTQMTFASALDQEMMPDMSTISGAGKMLTDNVIVRDFKPFNKVGEALKVDKFKEMVLDNMNISFRFEDGKVVVDPVDMKMGDIQANMFGSTSFEQDLDYTMNMAIPRKSFGSQANSMLDGWASKAKSKGLNVNLSEMVNVAALIGGTATDPKISTNLKDMAGDAVGDIKDQVKEKIEEKKEEVKQQVKEKVDDAKQKAKAEADKIIRDAEAKAAKIRADGKAAADKVRKEGYANAQKVEDKAKNKFQKIAAKKTADKMRSDADKSANKIEKESNDKANAVIAEAKIQAAKIK